MDLIERLATQQDREPRPELVQGSEIGEDKTLERFQKFSSPKFLKSPDFEVARN